MQRPTYEIAQVIQRFGEEFIEKHNPNSFELRTLDALLKCRTSALGGHKEVCDCCGKERISYNSCRNRHCPKCQSYKQAIWVEDRMNEALNVKYFHIVFTVPEVLNTICLLDSKWFYNAMFQAVWSTLQTFGYSHYGVESGAICVLHTWGQNLSLHPHMHCIVPAAGLTLKGNLKPITKQGKYIYPVTNLSTVLRGKLLEKIKKQLINNNQLNKHQKLLNQAWSTPWVVNCEPPFGSPKHIVKYLGQYTHRVAISNQRIQNIDDNNVSFYFKDYKDQKKRKLTKLSGIEFLRRFCLHILPYRFVKIRHYGILSSKFKSVLQQGIKKQKPTETTQERLKRITQFDIYQCPYCKTGKMQIIAVLPRIRSPGNVLYKAKNTLSIS
jgi:Zn finger protein HypA/HybF involved in hydrogenase expression